MYQSPSFSVRWIRTFGCFGYAIVSNYDYATKQTVKETTGRDVKHGSWGHCIIFRSGVWYALIGSLSNHDDDAGDDAK